MFTHLLDSSLASRAVSLAQLGEHDVAWLQSDALEVIDQLRAHGVPVLGGDVVAVEQGVSRLVGESWHCDRERDESESDYLVRSSGVSLDYIRTYPISYWARPLFLIVARGH